MRHLPSIIISGGDNSERLRKANQIAEQFLVSKSSPDYILVQPENTIGIEKLRELLPIINLKPYQSPKKIVIIKDAQTLTIEAQNAFLKTLEEPPDNTIIILLVENTDQLLSTIVSRCQIVSIQGSKTLEFDKEALKKELIAIKKEPLGLRFKRAAVIATTRENAKDWIDKVIFCLREMLYQSLDKKGQFSPDELLTLLKNAIQSKNYLTQNVNTRLAVENFLLKF